MNPGVFRHHILYQPLPPDNRYVFEAVSSVLEDCSAWMAGGVRIEDQPGYGRARKDEGRRTVGGSVETMENLSQ